MPVRSESAPAPALSPEVRFSSPGFLLANLGRTTEQYLTEAMEPLDLTPRQAAALLILRSHGPLPQQQLGEVLDMDANHLVLTLNYLEQAGLVARRRDPADRRRHIVEITKAGSERRAAVDRAVVAVEDELLDGLLAEDRETLRRVLLHIDERTGRRRRGSEE